MIANVWRAARKCGGPEPPIEGVSGNHDVYCRPPAISTPLSPPWGFFAWQINGTDAVVCLADVYFGKKNVPGLFSRLELADNRSKGVGRHSIWSNGISDRLLNTTGQSLDI